MHDPRADHLRAQDPADLVVAWESVEELLAAVPEGPGKDALRMVATGLPVEDIADRLGLPVTEVEVLAARARVRVLTAASPFSARSGRHCLT